MGFEVEENSPFALAASVGFAFLGIVHSAKQCGHVTLKGHLVYHNEQEYENRGHIIEADVVRWLRFMTSWGDEAREEVGYPDGLLELARALGIGGLNGL